MSLVNGRNGSGIYPARDGNSGLEYERDGLNGGLRPKITPTIPVTYSREKF